MDTIIGMMYMYLGASAQQLNYKLKANIGDSCIYMVALAALMQVKHDAREAMRVVFSVLTKCICMHKTKFLMNIFKYCFKDYIKLQEFANCNSFNYDA